MTFLAIIFLELLSIRYSVQWQEFEQFECYTYHFNASNTTETWRKVFNENIETCYRSKESDYYSKCLTFISNGILKSGCMNSLAWEYNYLCIHPHYKEMYRVTHDTLGVAFYKDELADCCSTNLCNNMQRVLEIVKTYEFRDDSLDFDAGLVSVFLIGLFISVLAGFIKYILNTKEQQHTWQIIDEMAMMENAYLPRIKEEIIEKKMSKASAQTTESDRKAKTVKNQKTPKK